MPCAYILFGPQTLEVCGQAKNVHSDDSEGCPHGDLSMLCCDQPWHPYQPAGKAAAFMAGWDARGDDVDRQLVSVRQCLSTSRHNMNLLAEFAEDLAYRVCQSFCIHSTDEAEGCPLVALHRLLGVSVHGEVERENDCST